MMNDQYMYHAVFGMFTMLQYIVNKTKLACPVDVLDEQKICGTDNRTYESLCRMILEADGVDVWFDGPCNRSDCHGSVSVT